MMNALALAPTTLPDTEPLAYLTAAVDAGYDAVGVRLFRSPGLPFHPVVGNGALIRDMKRVLADAHLPVLDVLSFYLQPATDVEQFAPALALGAELGARYAMTIGDDPEWGRLRDNLGRLCDVAARVGLTVVIEFVPFRVLATLPMALQIIGEVKRQNCAICLDPLHLGRSGGRPADLVGLDRRLFPYAQLSDGVLGPGEPDLAIARQRGVGERRMLGEGSLPLRELLAALPAGSPLSVELPMPKTLHLSARAWAKVALDDARRFLASIDAA